MRFAKEHGHTAEQVMSRELVTTTEEVDLAEVARLLEKHRITRLPVLDGRIVGFVSRADILRGFASVEPKLPTRGAPGDDCEIRKVVLAGLASAGVAPGPLNVTASDGRVQLWGAVRSDADERAAWRASLLSE